MPLRRNSETPQTLCESRLDTALVSELIEVERASGQALFGPFLARVAGRHTLDVDKVRASNACLDFKALAATTHEFTGIALSFGLTRVAQLAQAINASAASGMAALPSAIDELDLAISIDAAALRSYLDRM